MSPDTFSLFYLLLTITDNQNSLSVLIFVFPRFLLSTLSVSQGEQRMAAIALFAGITILLRRASAGNITTPFLLPNALFWNGPSPQTFVGEVNSKGPTTYYTLNCGDDTTPFYPGEGGCDENNSYTFSADVATTQFIVPT